MENKENHGKLYEFNRLKNFSISFLAIALGLVGVTLTWQKAEGLSLK